MKHGTAFKIEVDVSQVKAGAELEVAVVRSAPSEEFGDGEQDDMILAVTFAKQMNPDQAKAIVQVAVR